MRPPRMALGLLAPVALLVLVGALGTLQYRWVGQVGEAERAQLRESLTRRVQELGQEFDREIARAFHSFQLEAGDLDPAAPDAFVRRYDDWQINARFPGLLKTAWFTRLQDGKIQLFRFSPEEKIFAPAEWPTTLSRVRDRLTPGTAVMPPPPREAGTTLVMATSSPVIPEIPALVVPVLPLPAPLGEGDGPGVRAAAGFLVAFHADSRNVILELDRDRLQDTIMPALVTRHFPEDDRYRVTIADEQLRGVFTRGLAAGQHLGPEAADARAVFFTLRMEALRETVSVRVRDVGRGRVVAAPSGRGGAARTGGAAAMVTASRIPQGSQNKMSFVFEQRGDTREALRLATPGGWHVYVQHSAGSLDAAVAAVRRRNLWLSFGILAVLAASVGLIMVNARRSERLAAQQMDFVATVSHELRTPLAVIRSAAQNLSAGVVHEPAQASRYGDLIESEGRRLTDMVEQVLEYAGLSGNTRPVRAAPVDCGALVRDVVESCRGLIDEAHCDVSVNIAAGVPPAMADEGAIRRAMDNLIANALKYAADGGWLGLSVRSGGSRGRSEVLITVSDRGRGIDADDLAHVFEPFYRGRHAIERQIHGNGLGLSLVKRIAEAHGGRVSVKSSPGEGTAFTLHLPAASGTPATNVLSEPAHDAGRSAG